MELPILIIVAGLMVVALFTAATAGSSSAGRLEPPPSATVSFEDRGLFEAWTRAGERFALDARPHGGDLEGPGLRGTVEDRRVEARLQVRPAGRHSGTDGPLEPTDVECETTLGLQLPDHWQLLEVEKFDPSNFIYGELDYAVRPAPPVGETTQIGSVQLSDEAVDPIVGLVDDFDGVGLRDGRLEIRSVDAPPEDDSRWTAFFAERLDRFDELLEPADRVGTAPLELDLINDAAELEARARLASTADAPSTSRLVVEVPLGEDWPRDLEVRPIDRAGDGTDADPGEFAESFDIEGDEPARSDLLNDQIRTQLAWLAGDFDEVRIRDGRLEVRHRFETFDALREFVEQLDEVIDRTGGVAVAMKAVPP